MDNDSMYEQITEEYLNLGWLEEELKIEQLEDILSNHIYLPSFKLTQIAKRIVVRCGDSDDEEVIESVIRDEIDMVLDDVKALS